MHTETLSGKVRAELARLSHTAADDWFLVWRARYGIETVLKAVSGSKGGGEVITQPFTCVTALNPILSAGHIPVYVDTNYDDLSLDTSKLQASASSRAIVMQHSFGIESNMKTARTFANKHSLLLIEDSAHQLGMLAKKADKPLADISIHSFGVEKILPTKFGGAVWVNPDMKDHALRDEIVAALKQLPVIDRKTRGIVKRYRQCNRLLNHIPSLRSLFIATGLFEPAITPKELNGKNARSSGRPDNYILSGIMKEFTRYEPSLKNRATVAALYAATMPKGLTAPKHLQKEAAPVRFPVLCSSSEQAANLFNALRTAGHYSGKWYQPTLFPGVTNPELYNYDAELYPVAEDIAARILNLPTNITATEAKEILDVLQRKTN